MVIIKVTHPSRMYHLYIRRNPVKGPDDYYLWALIAISHLDSNGITARTNSHGLAINGFCLYRSFPFH